MDTSKSLCCILGKNGLVFCAFVHQIIFGKTENNKFIKNESFYFDLNKICELFCAFFKLIKAFTNKNFQANGKLCSNDGYFYKWKLQEENSEVVINLSIEYQEQTTLQLQLSICDFNDIILLVSHLLLPSLGLKDKEAMVIQTILTLDLDQILKLKNDKAVNAFLKTHEKQFDLSYLESYNITLLISYHLDIIVAINTMKCLYNHNLNITHKNIDMMLSCH